MAMSPLFSPSFIYPYVWLALILGAGAWLVARTVSPAGETYRAARMALPAAALAVLTAPLWFEGLVQEVQCRSAGLRLGEPVQDEAVTVHWESFSPDPQMYSLGVLKTASPAGQAAMGELVRAVSEGRVRSFDIPFEPRRGDGAEVERVYQRFYLAPADESMGPCVKNLPHGTRFAPGTCLAFVQSRGIQSTYELKGSALQSEHGRTVQITHRATGRILGQHTLVERDVGETGLARVGLRKMRAWSCTPEARRNDLGPGLVHLVFGTQAVPRVEPAALSVHAKAAWSPVSAPPLGEPVPAGRAGIEFWTRKGKVRALGTADVELWKRASGKADARMVPVDTYLITGDLVLPDGLYGGHSVQWIVPKGMHIPPGPRGHSRFYEVDRGCVWPRNLCDGG